MPFPNLQTRNEQEPITQSDDNDESDDTTWYASRYEMFYTQVSLASLRVFQHDRRCHNVSEIVVYLSHVVL